MDFIQFAVINSGAAPVSSRSFGAEACGLLSGQSPPMLVGRCCETLAPRLSLGGHLILDHRFGDGEGEAVLVVASFDVGALGAVGEKASFEEDGGVLDPGDY